jgi:7-cyano-7-deazaguanine synthase in queuosine biosynthesis
MIKSSVLLKHYSLGNGPSRYKMSDGELKPYEIILGDDREFEELMVSLYLLDKYIPNETEFCYETRLRSVWESLKDDVEQLFLFLTGRKLSLQFEETQSKLHYLQQQLLSTELSSKRRGMTCLFSGGLDSTAGALILAKDNQAPILSHTATGNITLGRVRTLRSNPVLMDLPLIVTEMRSIAADSSPTTTRGLLFLANAMVLASSMGFEQICLPENGPLMINPHVSSISTPTRNAHPYLVTTLEKIHNQISSSKLRVIPIFKDKTKAEMIADIRSYETLINNTWSCFKVQGQARMCGICFACMVRRLSALASGYEEPINTYQFDPFFMGPSQVGQSLKADLDILYDTLLYLQKVLDNEQLIENEMFMIPNGFFEDPFLLLRRFSLDMFLGLNKYQMKLGSAQLGPLGRFSMRILEKIPSSDLQQRDEELSSIS